MRNLVKRYVAAMIRDAKTEEGLTEENFKVCVYLYIYMHFSKILYVCEPYFSNFSVVLVAYNLLSRAVSVS